MNIYFAEKSLSKLYLKNIFDGFQPTYIYKIFIIRSKCHYKNYLLKYFDIIFQ